MTHTSSSDERDTPPLWKQLAGAGAGMMIALGLYHGYRYAQPVVTALLIPPGGFAPSALEGSAQFSDKTMNEGGEDYDRTAQRIQAQALKAISAAAEGQAQETVPMPMEEPQEITPSPWTQTTVETPAPSVPAPVMERSAAGLRPLTGSAPASERQAVATQIQEVRSSAPDLPDSGISLWIATFGAMAGAAWHVRRKREMAGETA